MAGTPKGSSPRRPNKNGVGEIDIPAFGLGPPPRSTEANETFGPENIFGLADVLVCSDDIPAWREGGRKMFKVPAAIRNHFVLVQYFEAKAASSRSSKEILVPIAKAAPGSLFPLPKCSSF